MCDATNGMGTKGSSCLQGCFFWLHRAPARNPDYSSPSSHAACSLGGKPKTPSSGLVWSPADWATPVNQFSRQASDTEATDVTYTLDMGKSGTILEARVPSRARRRVGEAGVVPGWCAGADVNRKDGLAAPLAFGLEQLFSSPGSLPAGLSSTQRSILQDQPSPTGARERIAQVPRKLLTASGSEGQTARRQMLQGSTIVFFTAGYEGKRFVYEKAHELGVKAVMIENPDSWSKQLVDEGVVAKFIPVDMSQSSDVVFNQALDAIKALSSDPEIGEVDGIATVVELSVPITVRLAEAMGLPGHTTESVDSARDKHRTRTKLAEAGLPTPAHCHVHGEADLERAAQSVGFPAVLKPVSGAASLGVKKVESKDDLYATYQEVSRELASLVVSSGALVKDDGQGVGVNVASVIDTAFLLEQYLDGDEVDVDIVMSEGEWRYAAVSDNGPTLEPYFNETWAVTPSLLPREKQVALKELAINAVKALGFHDGVFHVECKYTSNGPQLIEVNARMGGGPVYKTNLLTWNVDLVEETLLCAVGIPCRPDVPRKPSQCIANCDVNTLRSGVLADMSFMEPLIGREGVVSFDPHVAAGAHITGPQDGLPTWLVEIIVSKPTAKEALEFLKELETEIQARVRLA